MREVKILIKEDGSQTIETSGFQGQACVVETEKILKSLAKKGVQAEITEDKKKAEYNAMPTATGTGIHA